MPAVTGSRHTQGKVLLVNPNRMKPPVVPLALDCLTHALRRSKFDVEILDLCFAEDVPGEIEKCLMHDDVLAVAVTLRNADDTFFVTRDFCLDHYKKVIEQIKNHTSAPVILGGSGFSIMPRDILNYYDLDLGIWGEGEYSLPLLLGRLEANEDYEDVPGLVYRKNDRLFANPAHFLDLSSIPAPGRNAVDNHRYFVEGGMGGIETKRGCPKGCIYCVDPVGKGKRVRLRSPQSVADELESLLETGIDHFHFCDSEFNIPEQHARDVCLELAARKLGDKLRWYTYATPAGFSRELAALFRKAGCAGVNFGVDSGCDHMLRALGRDFAVEDIGRTAEACRREGIISMFDLLVGGPGETRESLGETIAIMKKASPDRIGVNLGVRVFPQTRLAQMVRREGPLNKNPNLHGAVTGNRHFFYPIYYVSSNMGPDVADYVSRLIDSDSRFLFFGDTAGADRNYNYNDNTVLVNAIKAGYRGAFWDILRRLGGAS